MIKLAIVKDHGPAPAKQMDVVLRMDVIQLQDGGTLPVPSDETVRRIQEWADALPNGRLAYAYAAAFLIGMAQAEGRKP